MPEASLVDMCIAKRLRAAKACQKALQRVTTARRVAISVSDPVTVGFKYNQWLQANKLGLEHFDGKDKVL